MKKIIFTIFLISGLMLPNLTNGANDEPPSPPSRDRCESIALASKFGKVLSSTLDTSGELKYFFDDIFHRNTCLRRDILNIMDRIDAIAGAMRSAVYTCNLKEFDQYVSEYYKSKMELFYLRNFAPTKKGIFKKTDVFPITDVEIKMIDKFGKNINKQQIKDAISRFQIYYELDKYANCKDIDFSLLFKKIKNFQENMGALFSGATFTESWSNEEKAYNETYPSYPPTDESTTNKGFFGGIWDGVKKRLDVKIIVEDIKITNVFDKEQWVDSAEKSGNKAQKTFDDMVSAYKKNEQSTAERTRAMQKEAEIEVTYYEGAGIQSDTYLCSIYRLNQQIEQMIKDTQTFAKCAKIPLDKQCKNKN